MWRRCLPALLLSWWPCCTSSTGLQTCARWEHPESLRSQCGARGSPCWPEEASWPLAVTWSSKPADGIFAAHPATDGEHCDASWRPQAPTQSMGYVTVMVGSGSAAGGLAVQRLLQNLTCVGTEVSHLQPYGSVQELAGHSDTQKTQTQNSPQRTPRTR